MPSASEKISEGDKGMEKFQKEFIAIIQAAFSEEIPEISADFDWKRAVNVAIKHNIVPIIYYGAVKYESAIDEAYMQELLQRTLNSSVVSLRQNYEIEQLENAFKAENIAYMPLKGSILRELYPNPEMRTMGDVDILIQLDQYHRIEPIMQKLGFTFRNETDHELIWTKPTLFLELHKRIMTSYNKDFYRYFGTGWKIAKSIPGSSRYEMSTEDFYIFTFVHFTKHYRISGIGIKHLIDLWVYANAHPELNWAYVEKELKKMDLSVFHANIQRTIDVWFNGAPETDVTDLITSVIFSSGQYGTAEMAIVNRALQHGNNSALKIKTRRLLHSIFLPYRAMKDKYAILKKLPVLLPVMWIVRCFEVLFHQKSKLQNYMNEMNHIDSAQVEDNKNALHAVGLDFDSKAS